MMYYFIYASLIFVVVAAVMLVLALIHKCFEKLGGKPLFKVGSPCSKHWRELKGDTKVRFCDLCQKNVHNVCKVSKLERNALLKKLDAGESVCIYIEPSLVRKFGYSVALVFFTSLSYVGVVKYQYQSQEESGILGGGLSDHKFQDFGSPEK